MHKSLRRRANAFHLADLSQARTAALVRTKFVGINSAQHPITIADYGKSLLLKRGQVTKISFKADKAGVFAIRCATHQPSMVGELVVLPRK